MEQREQNRVSIERQAVVQMLDELEKNCGHFPNTADISMRYAEKVNQGELVDLDELAEEYTLRLRNELLRKLQRPHTLMAFRQLAREQEERMREQPLSSR